MKSNAKKVEDILKARGVEINEDIIEYKIPEAHESFQKLIAIYYGMKVTADMEAPYWFNRIWWENDGDLNQMKRAKAVAGSYAHITPTILPWEKLVMSKTTHMRGAFPFPWVCGSFFNAQAQAFMDEVDAPPLSEADAVSQVGTGGGNVTKSYGEIISIAQKFGVRKEDIPVLVKVSKYWEGIAIEDISKKYGKYLKNYDQYQREMDAVVIMFDSWAIPQGREVMNYYVPLQYGFDKIQELCDEKMQTLMGEAGEDGVLGMSRGYYYACMKEVAKGLSQWAQNYADKARDLASREPDEAFKKNYMEIAKMMDNVAHKAPASFREALQMTYLCHLGVVNEDPQSGQSIGRLGQVLQPFYEKDIADGVCTDEDVIELLELYRIKITAIECFASSGVTGGVLSGNTFNNLGIGGRGHDGLSAATPLEYLIIEAAMRAHTPQPTLSVLYDEKLPDAFLMKAAMCIKLGMGFPAFMNARVSEEFMLRQYGEEGMTVTDARAWMLGGCLENSPGSWSPLEYNGKVTWIPGGAGPTAGTGIHFTGLPKVLELVLTNGVDARTDKMVFPPHNEKIDSFEKLLELWKRYLDISNDIANKVNNIQMDIWRKLTPPTVNSLLKKGCWEKGQTIADCGALYNGTINFESCGTITFINSLAAIKKLVFEEKKYTLEEMKDAMLNNFGFKTAYETGVFSPDFREATEDAPKYAKIFADCINAPKYGNANPEADSLLKWYEDYMAEILPKLRSYYGRPEYMCQISVSTHGPQGFVTLATADGRLAGTTYSDGSVSAAAGTDRNGVYAVFESATVYDHSMEQNSQMNLKIHPSAVKGQTGTRKLLNLIQAYMRKGGFHVQFNIVGSDTLREAQKNIDAHRDLMVRVAGFTQYWCEIGKAIQDEVIYRTEYDEV
ncbi:MAG: 4-hydroxyphenylacetate decarboxylase large subunit [Phascolarctobacterium sp.]|nr:4-hydroxyphenylacetate decarboxylase large subunit [Phascolarctobacterium sp.]MCD8198968.1 4-hydroxyphenylacetate decarboxylase large subunit [Phascolarctobacterium sp.]